MRKYLRRFVDRHVSLNGLPPKDLQMMVGGDYRAVGDEFFGYLQNDVGLKPDHRVLDVGCGCGRIAMPLTKYLSPAGSYEGFDILPPLVNWCCRKIERRHKNFRFQLADVHNPAYHPDGRQAPHEFRFPFESQSFDCVYLTSVFTHMLPAGLEQYLSEISRVLKPGGRTLITFFLLNDESRQLIKQGKSSQPFHHTHDECLVVLPDSPEAAIAYPESTIRDLHKKYGLDIARPVQFGKWCGREQGRSYQDMILAVRSGEALQQKPCAA
jgi:ubiquinone/menaquinone biosynthesis C-methylase UbiE